MPTFFIVLLAMLLSLVGCSGSTDPVQEEVYTLVEVDESTLPAVHRQDSNSGRLEVLSGTLTLKSNGTYTEVIPLRYTATGPSNPFPSDVMLSTIYENGKYTISGSTVQFAPSPRRNYSGTLNGKYPHLPCG